MSKYDFLEVKDSIMIISTNPLLNNSKGIVTSILGEQIFIKTIADKMEIAIPKNGINSRGITDILKKNKKGRYVTSEEFVFGDDLSSGEDSPEPIVIQEESFDVVSDVKKLEDGSIVKLTSKNDVYDNKIGTIVENDKDTITIFIIDIGESVTINYVDWDINSYHITNIVESNEIVQNIAVDKQIDEDIDIIEDTIYSLHEQKESMYNAIVDKLDYTNHHILTKLSKNISNIADLINETQFQENNILQDKVKLLNQHPYRHIIKNHQYNHFIQPISFDQKKKLRDFVVYGDIEEEEQLTDKEISIRSKEFNTNNLLELHIYNELYSRYTNNTISINTLYKLLYNGGLLDEPIIIGSLHLDNIQPILRPYINSNDRCPYDNYRMEIPLEYSIPVKRTCLPLHICRGDSAEFEIEYENRIADGSEYRFYDNPGKMIIGQGLGKSISICHGSADKNENIYFNPNDRYVVSGKEFNLSINKLPDKHRYIEGEFLNIVGLFLNFSELNRYTWNLNTREQINTIDGDTYSIVNPLIRKGVMLYDLIYKNNTKGKSNISIIKNKKQYNNEDNHIYLFDDKDSKSLDKNTYIDKSLDILPEISDISKLESKAIQKMVSLYDLNKLLSKYNIDTDNLNIQNKNWLLENSGIMINNLNDNIYFIKKTHKKSNYIHLCFRNLDYKLIEYFNHMSIKKIDNSLYFENLLSYAKTNHYDDVIFNIYIVKHLFKSDYIQVGETQKDKLYHSINYCIRYIRNSTRVYQNPLIICVHDDFDYNKILNIFGIHLLKNRFTLTQHDNLFELYGSYIRTTMIHSNFDLYIELLKLNNIENELRYTDDKEYSLSQLKEKLLLILKQAKREKKQSNIYLKKCKGFHIKKIYNSKKDLLNDNLKDIPVDRNFDNIQLYKQVLAEYESHVGRIEHIENHIHKLIILYHTYSPTELNIHIENGMKKLLENRDLTHFNIVNNDYALYIKENKSKLYKRVNGVWTPKQSDDIVADSDLCYQDSISLAHIDVEKILDKNKCIQYEGNCITKNIAQWLDKISFLKNKIKLYSSNNKHRLSLISDKEVCIEKIQHIIEKYNIKNTVIPVEKPKVVKDALKEQLDNKLYNILKIDDVDQRYDNLSKLIDKFGIINKKKSSYAFIEETNLDSEGNIYDIEKDLIDCEKITLGVINQDKNTIVILGSGSYEKKQNLFRATISSDKDSTISELEHIYVDICIRHKEIVIKAKKDTQWIQEEIITIDEITRFFLTNNYEIRAVFNKNVVTIYLNSIFVTNYRMPISIPSDPLYLHLESGITSESINSVLKIWTGKTINQEIFNKDHKFDDWIYWNYDKQQYRMCCKHHIDLVKTAWLPNEDRARIFKKIESEWSGVEEDGNIYCRNCNELISISKEV